MNPAGVATMESKEMAYLIARCNAISSRNCTPLFTLFIEAFGCAVRSFECLILHENMYAGHSGFDIMRPKCFYEAREADSDVTVDVKGAQTSSLRNKR